VADLLTSEISRRPADELEKMSIDGGITLAARVIQSISVQHMDVPAPIADQPCLLQFTGDHGHAAALHPQHLGQELLC
jgi:hypothetical protein